ncbi:MAG TPA: hypothetical protein VMZ27_13455 [Candidatus Saccharimonadales bacterium]|nr:hypothetical protein [Candidatus Saccharimonadales bacterium]
MRLHVIPVPNAEGYNVRVDLMNETKREVTIRADTKAGPEPTSLNDYIELSTSIETYPTIVPWIGGVAQRLRNGLPAEYVLPAGEVISTRLADHWTAPQELRGQS